MISESFCVSFLLSLVEEGWNGEHCVDLGQSFTTRIHNTQRQLYNTIRVVVRSGRAAYAKFACVRVYCTLPRRRSAVEQDLLILTYGKFQVFSEWHKYGFDGRLQTWDSLPEDISARSQSLARCYMA